MNSTFQKLFTRLRVVEGIILHFLKLLLFTTTYFNLKLITV